jgi:hypothetical protein
LADGFARVIQLTGESALQGKAVVLAPLWRLLTDGPVAVAIAGMQEWCGPEPGMRHQSRRWSCRNRLGGWNSACGSSQEQKAIGQCELVLSFVSRLVRLDFGHFRTGVKVVHVFVRFQLVFLPNGTKPGEPFTEKSPDMTRLAALAKVQTKRNHHNRYPVSLLWRKLISISPTTGMASRLGACLRSQMQV